MEKDITSWVTRLESLRKCMWEPEKCPHEGGCDYTAVDMCLDQIISEMEQYLKSPIRLPEFKGYTVDERLREFRKMKFGERPEFIPFDSPKGQKLLSDMKAKTNREWYPYENFGGYFKLENGDLFGCPMNADGSRDDTPYEVDWYEARDNDFDPNEIVRELEKKP